MEGAMVEQEILTKIRDGICAIGYITVPLQKFSASVHQPYFKVVGTGFLVRANLAMTNRHVIERLLYDQADLGFPDDQRLLMFVHPIDPTVCQADFRPILQLHEIGGEMDVGFVSFPPDKESASIQPLQLQSHMSFQVSEPVGVCGYPYGHHMLQKKDGSRVYRWGPVLQQGYISAVSPFEKANPPNEILLDARIAGGMSGAPVFRPSDGTVIGIIYKAWEATTALALPLDAQVVQNLLKQYDSQKGVT
jgi:S1-C subfamily serine protease